MNMQPIESLEKYGFAFVNERSDEYYCLYKDNNSTYGDAFIYDSELDEMIESNSFLNTEEIVKFLNTINLTKNEYKQLSFGDKLNFVCRYFGTKEVFGQNFCPLSEEEALEILNEFKN